MLMLMLLLLLLLPLLLLLRGYPNSPWQYHTQDGPVCIALAPCNRKKNKF